MKFAEDIFPKGTFRSQQTDGAYIDETLSQNLNIIAEKIGDDMSFLLCISGHDMVGTGKTTIATHIGSYLTWKINNIYKVNNTFTHRNIVMKAQELPKRSMGLPQYSVLLVDEGDELTTHGAKELAISLKRYFRKCRQLNQILIIILPSFFELPKFYALSRSQVLIDVEFKEKFDRGFFKFYGMKSKKLLYLKGKKEWDYDAYKYDFDGRFFGSYCFFPNCKEETAKYLKLKRQDLEDDAKDRIIESPQAFEKQLKIRLYNEIYNILNKNGHKITHPELALGFKVSLGTAENWVSDYKQARIDEENKLNHAPKDYTNNFNQNETNLEEEGLTEDES